MSCYMLHVIFKCSQNTYRDSLCSGPNMSQQILENFVHASITRVTKLGADITKVSGKSKITWKLNKNTSK